MTKLVPWWADKRLTDEQKQVYADRLAESFASAWLSTSHPSASLVRAARIVIDSPPPRSVKFA